MNSPAEVTFREFEPQDLDAVRLLSYMGDDFIEEQPELIVGVLDGEIVAAAGLEQAGEGEFLLKPLIIKSDLDELALTTELLVLLEKKAKAEAHTTLLFDVPADRDDLVELAESHGYKLIGPAKTPRTKTLHYAKDLNYFRQHDLGL